MRAAHTEIFSSASHYFTDIFHTDCTDILISRCPQLFGRTPPTLIRLKCFPHVHITLEMKKKCLYRNNFRTSIDSNRPKVFFFENKQDHLRWTIAPGSI